MADIIVGVDEIIRSSRRSIGLIVSHNGLVTARIPNRMPISTAQHLISQKIDWINRQKVRMMTKPVIIKKTFDENEKFLFLGQEFILKVCANLDKAVVLDHDNGFLKVADVVQNRRNQILIWYQDQAKVYINERVGQIAASFGISVKAIKIRDAQTRWGSCVTGGSLNFTWRLIMAPKEVVDYVIIHELAHIKHMNHSSRFWAEVEDMMPNYTQYERWLKDNGRMLVLV